MKKFIFVFLAVFILSFVGVDKKAEALSCLSISEKYYASYKDGEFIDGFKIEIEKINDIKSDSYNCGYFKEEIIKIKNKKEIDSIFRQANYRYPLDSGVYSFTESHTPGIGGVYKEDSNPNNIYQIKEKLIQDEIENRKEIKKAQIKSFFSFEKLIFYIILFLAIISLISLFIKPKKKEISTTSSPNQDK